MGSEARRTALVTGASSGIGLEFARQLATDGFDLVVVARREERLRELATELNTAHGTGVEVLTADLTEADDLARVEKRVTSVDLLVNNAGFATSGPFYRLDLERERRLVDVLAIAVMRLMHAALGPMVERGDGGIINVSSLAGFQALPRNATYAASKAFVTTLTEAVAEEVRPFGVHVMALCPGFVKTEFHPDDEIESSPLPNRAFMDPEPVVREGLRALRQGRVICVPGAGYKAMRVASALTPPWLRRRAIGAATSQMGGKR